MAQLALGLLGPLQVVLNGRPVVGLTYAKVRALLAYLAVETHPHSRDTLAELLWPGQPAAAARRSLRVALATLRHALGDSTTALPFLLATRDNVQINPASDIALDLTSFADLIRTSSTHMHPATELCPACAARMAEAVALYRGNFLQQLEVRDSLAFEEWVTLWRERLHRNALDALAALAAYHEAHGQDDQARQYAWRTLALEPWDEAAHRCVMRVLAHKGQRSAALEQYTRCRKVLADELGVEPTAETTALYEQIRTGALTRAVGGVPQATPPTAPQEPQVPAPDAASAPAKPTLTPTNLPIPMTPLIGREQELVRVHARLCDPEVRLLTLVGPPGTGKTRLAIQAAAELNGAFRDRVHFVALAPIHDPALVLAGIGQALGVADAGDLPLLERLKCYLHAKQILLLLDNFEQVLAAAPQLAELLAYAPQLKLLVTSRVVLHLRGEQEFQVLPLALPDIQHLPSFDRLARYAAVALFVARARDVRPEFELNATNAPTVAEICCRLDGLPLAIELGAARIKLFAPTALLKRLEQRLTLLIGGPCDAPARQQTLRATIDWSYHLLAADEQRLFRRLGVFSDGCTQEAVERICDLPSDQASDVLDRLAALFDKSLLQQAVEADDELRYTMLETIREYALEQLGASDEAETIRQRHAAYFLMLAEAAAPETRRANILAWLARLEREHDNLRAALHWSRNTAGQADTQVRLVGSLWDFWLYHGHTREGRKCLHTALERDVGPGAVSWAARARALFGASVLAMHLGDSAETERYAAAGAALYRQLNDRHGLAFTLSLQGFSIVEQSRGVNGWAILDEGLLLTRLNGDPWQMAVIFGQTGGHLLALKGADQQVRTMLAESLTLSRSLNHPFLLAQVLHMMGVVALIEHDGDQARAAFAESLSFCRDLGDRLSIALNLRYLGEVARQQGDYAAARALLVESLVCYDENGSKQGIAECIRGLAMVAAAWGQPEQAVRLLAAAEGVRTTIGTYLDPAGYGGHESILTAARSQLGDATFAAVWAAGRALSLEQAVEEALAWGEAAPTAVEIPPPSPPPPTNLPTPLIGREREVAAVGALLRQPEKRLVTLTSVGGSGKT